MLVPTVVEGLAAELPTGLLASVTPVRLVSPKPTLVAPPRGGGGFITGGPGQARKLEVHPRNHATYHSHALGDRAGVELLHTVNRWSVRSVPPGIFLAIRQQTS